MTRILSVLTVLAVLAGLLGGCEMPPPVAAVATAPAQIQVPPAAPRPENVAPQDAPAVPTLAAPEAVLPPPDPPMLAQQRAGCLRAGGVLVERAAGVRSCVTPTRDAGQRCIAASDCEGVCLARSGSCAPFQPLFGCQEVFTLPGRRETLCLE